MRVPNDNSFDTLKHRMHNTLQLTNDQLVDEIYYRQPFTDAGQQYFFQSIQLKNDDDDALMYYNGKWNIPCQGEFLGYSFTGNTT